MTNIENQKARNREKWFKSQIYKEDLSGKMAWCYKCERQTCTNGCRATQKERDEKYLCAKAYNLFNNHKG